MCVSKQFLKRVTFLVIYIAVYYTNYNKRKSTKSILNASEVENDGRSLGGEDGMALPISFRINGSDIRQKYKQNTE